MVTAMSTAVSSANSTMPPSYRNESYWLVSQNMRKIPSSETPPAASSTRRALSVTGAKVWCRGRAMASAAPIRRAKTRVSVPS